jgi:toxin ParE1/3/4
MSSAGSANALRRLVASPEIILAPCVEDELLAIWEYIARDNPAAATRVAESAYETFAILAAKPDLGRPRKFRNTRLRNIRSWHICGFDNYVIFYRSIPQGIQVLHVFHGARDLDALFERE